MFYAANDAFEGLLTNLKGLVTVRLPPKPRPDFLFLLRALQFV